MKLYVMSVFDSAVQGYSSPVFVPHRNVGVRSFTDEVNRQAQDNQLYLHPDDFQFVLLAVFDSDTGLFEDAGREVVVRGKDVKRDASQ